MLWIGVDGDDNWFIVDEHYGKQQTSTYWAGILNAHPLSGRVVQSYGDPGSNSGKSIYPPWVSKILMPSQASSAIQDKNPS